MQGPITNAINGNNGNNGMSANHTISGPHVEGTAVGTQSLDGSTNIENQQCAVPDTSNIPDQDTTSGEGIDTIVDVSDDDNNQEAESTAWWPPELLSSGEMGFEESQTSVGEDGEVNVQVRPSTTSIGHGLRVSKGIRNAALLDTFWVV